MKENYHFEDLCLDIRIILKRILSIGSVGVE
jgi:hypothetical protein